MLQNKPAPSSKNELARMPSRPIIVPDLVSSKYGYAIRAGSYVLADEKAVDEVNVVFRRLAAQLNGVNSTKSSVEVLQERLME